MSYAKELEELTQKLTESDNKLAESEKLFRTAFCVNPLPMALTSLDGTFIKVNKALCKRIELREDDLLGKKPADFCLYVRQEERNEIVEKLTAGEKILNMPVAFQSRGNVINSLLTSVVVTIDEVPYILSVFQEII